MSTFSAWMGLMDEAESSIDIAALYWTLADKSGYPTSVQVRVKLHIANAFTISFQGGKVLQNMITTAMRGVKVLSISSIHLIALGLRLG